jgi:hypothetical protein
MDQRKFWISRQKETTQLTELKSYKEIAKVLNITSPNNISVLDTKDTLVLLHYRNPKSDSHIRGIIFDTSSQKIVCKSFPYTEETEDILSIEKSFSPHLNITKAHEGTILRLFFFNGSWILSTHKKINGRNSRWSGRCFGQLFDETFSSDFSNFNKNLVYIFLLSHSENRIVINTDSPTLYLTGVYNGTELVHPSDVPIDFLFTDSQQPKEIMFNEKIQCNSFEELKTFFETLNSDIVSGILVYSKDMYIKITLTEYTKNKYIRGNNPNLNIRFIELYKTGKEKELENLFPNTNFSLLREKLEKLLLKLEELYNIRYVEKEFCRLDYPWARILDKIYYNNDNKTTVREQILEKIFAKQLFDLIEE